MIFHNPGRLTGALIAIVWAAAGGSMPTQTLTTLFSFDQNNGGDPQGLVQATNGLIYGVTAGGGTSVSGGPCGTSGCGTLFKMTDGRRSGDHACRHVGQ